MTRQSIPLDHSLTDYLHAIGVTEHPVLRELREFTAGHRLAKMQIAPEQGQFMGWLARLIGARRYLEIGVFTGYSALAVALALPEDGEVVACDVSDEFTRVAREYWHKAGVAERIHLTLQPALYTLQALLDAGRHNDFDLAFIDADKPSTPAYFEACLQLVRPGGVIVLDNIFLGGRVIAPQDNDPPGVHTMHAFNAGLAADPRIRLSVLPMGDGMTLAMKL
ncbi:MAG: class I SAM-dependent methyltransferase [Paludibacterium sp.]|uniref:class I SAM-dependent methyltransferase n=1 Tax=Paludibacterium sp. TaxID=1917523 RepID=UPI0025FBF4F2|nr:class I SAM-dependent methyltransferase [Paludibacterium sp.]MBV8046014.1 class I SAM-dependent methyltransferase [Paludibacterium sp.]MBV8647779.1 class I SAM-dependent methyltransferase [Paludibacterium sp.]